MRQSMMDGILWLEYLIDYVDGWTDGLIDGLAFSCFVLYRFWDRDGSRREVKVPCSTFGRRSSIW